LYLAAMYTPPSLHGPHGKDQGIYWASIVTRLLGAGSKGSGSISLNTLGSDW